MQRNAGRPPRALPRARWVPRERSAVAGHHAVARARSRVCVCVCAFAPVAPWGNGMTLRMAGTIQPKRGNLRGARAARTRRGGPPRAPPGTGGVLGAPDGAELRCAERRAGGGAVMAVEARHIGRAGGRGRAHGGRSGAPRGEEAPPDGRWRGQVAGRCRRAGVTGGAGAGGGGAGAGAGAGCSGSHRRCGCGCSWSRSRSSTCPRRRQYAGGRRRRGRSRGGRAGGVGGVGGGGGGHRGRACACSSARTGAAAARGARPCGCRVGDCCCCCC